MSGRKILSFSGTGSIQDSADFKLIDRVAGPFRNRGLKRGFQLQHPGPIQNFKQIIEFFFREIKRQVQPGLPVLELVSRSHGIITDGTVLDMPQRHALGDPLPIGSPRFQISANQRQQMTLFQQFVGITPVSSHIVCFRMASQNPVTARASSSGHHCTQGHEQRNLPPHPVFGLGASARLAVFIGSPFFQRIHLQTHLGQRLEIAL